MKKKDEYLPDNVYIEKTEEGDFNIVNVDNKGKQTRSLLDTQTVLLILKNFVEQAIEEACEKLESK